VDAAILAAAGLLRLGLEARIGATLDAPAWLPAAGQGAIAVQARADDEEMRALLAPLDDAATSRATTAERAFLAALEGGCQVPIGALAVRDPATQRETLHGLIADVAGRTVLRGAAPIGADAVAAGEALARVLRVQGADEILAGLRTPGVVPSPQPE
jgi:hydroxymethylbilane synthase